ncbi:MAG TPA: hypothetical protein VIH59_05405 [Candidatus Tectomicrobia bacterium]
MAVVAMIGGIILALIGAFYTIGLLLHLGAPQGRFVVDLLGLLALGVLPLGLGLGSLWYGKRRLAQEKQAAQAHREATLERAILQAARLHPQGVTVEECAANTPFSPQDMQAKFEQLYLDGKLEMEVTEQGRLVYKLKAT